MRAWIECRSRRRRPLGLPPFRALGLRLDDVDDKPLLGPRSRPVQRRFFFDTVFGALRPRCAARATATSRLLPTGCPPCARAPLDAAFSGVGAARSLGHRAARARPSHRALRLRPPALPGSALRRAPGRSLARLIAARWRRIAAVGYTCVEARSGVVSSTARARARWCSTACSAYLAIVNGSSPGCSRTTPRKPHLSGAPARGSEIAWHGRVWTSSRWRAGVRTITSGDRRRRWLHLALTHEGARQRTSWWR